ncbi:S41 family peptidase [Deinococcus roseus]|uniref:Interphotoreceptor retinoid-binding protein n=1 Tax=Deinococcus roseus TaxID=392414 RepID=A0ABQ2D784_9DEIO|nr:S41 family peptidase [Deinococcus roseus]GGJ48421.1 interphotoreceptor retinoid-binding protein [Deinococcus roseus]
METLDQNLLSSSTRSQLLSLLAVQFRDHYVYPQTGQVLAAALEEWATQETTDKTATASWCKALTARLRQLIPDKHLNVFPQTVEETRGQAPHRGIQKFEFLNGDIAYLELTGFFELEEAAPMMDAVMTLARPSKALIIDLRRNGGGSGDSVLHLCSHLLPANTHLQTFHQRGSNFQRQTWTLPYLQHRDTEKPVVVLTSGRTGSAAEEFCYNLQALKRATLIGEPTAGAAHTVSIISLNEQVGAFIPSGHPISPYTQTHWEGIGVQPDIHVKSEDALQVALDHLSKP